MSIADKNDKLFLLLQHFDSNLFTIKCTLTVVQRFEIC